MDSGQIEGSLIATQITKMSKRVHAKSNGGMEDAEGSRHKRRREGHMSDVGTMKVNPSGSREKGGGMLSKAEVKEMGTKIWQTVKDAVKDGRQLSVPFLVKPSKQDYPDYYLYIRHPIALDDIKKHLNKGKYSSLQDVRSDFELLFGNAKHYNRPDSIIHEDADYLLELVHKTYHTLVLDQSDDDESSSPDLHELLKERLDKLVSKADANDGRVLSNEFMQLPSKKLWPFYYIEIKNPKCFDDVYGNLHRKEYDSSATFAADVELIFSNATAFNQDGTQIFNDAVTLRDYFRRLMSDLPSPYALPDYTKPTNKIRIRPVHATQTATPRPVATKQESPLTLKVPPAQPPPAQVAAPSKASTPALTANTSTLPVAPVTVQRPPPLRAPAPKPSTSQTQPTKKSATPQPAATGQAVSFINATPSHYPRTQTPQIPPVPTVTNPTVAPAPVLRASSVLNTTQTRPQTPASQVVYPLSRQLKSVNVQIQPNHRRLRLDHRDGVKTWFIRLVPGELSLLVNDVTYMEEEEEESSEDEHLDAEKEGDDDSMDVDHEVSPSKKKGKGRGRGRPPKVLAVKAQAAKAAKTAKKVSRKPEDIQLKLNNFVVSEQPEKPGEWNVCLVTGSNVIEIGEVGGMIWKLHAERVADA